MTIKYHIISRKKFMSQILKQLNSSLPKYLTFCYDNYFILISFSKDTTY